MGYREYLASLEKFGIHLGLERISHLLEKLGEPHKKLKAIHIAGTNGKGSTAVMIASMLKEAGYRVGLYTSPHLLDYPERIRVNGRDIATADLAKGLELVKKIAGRMKSKPTVFETLTAVAFWYFARKKVDYAVLEVGLGGRLDATNVVTPLVSIITNIDHEHTEVLGRTLARIAAEKAAIIKPGVPVVTAEKKAEPLRMIKKFAQQQGSLLIQVDRRQEAGDWRLLGEHQKLNAACAVAAVRLARIEVSRSAIKQGLSKADWPGRFQVVSKKPLVILDGAHNPAGARALKVTIRRRFPARYTIIYGCQRTKDHQAFLKGLKPIASSVIVTRSSHQQAQDPVRIVDGLKWGKPVHIAHSLAEAIQRWDGQSPLLITGSLFLVADGLKLL
ncbi:bifunctional folylpolyglutamate synthase/dihydrofolate synthase [Candidatus Margulisiibacteriota bacterium]